MLEHFPVHSCSAILHPARATKEMDPVGVLWVTEAVKTHGLHSGDGKPTIKGQSNMREVLREQKVQPTTGLKAIDFLMEDVH